MSTTFTHPPRPPSLTISKACTYKTVSTTSKSISIPIDIYLPPNPPKNDVPHPIMLFIHGGGWTGGNRTDYCRPLFHRFLAQNFIVASMDYRLLPETPLAGQLEDIRDVEPWLRGQLAPLLKADGFDVEVENGEIVVVGASAGAHLALLTAILSLYGPTNLHNIPSVRRGRLSTLTLPPITPFLLTAATDFSNPPIEMKIPQTAADYLSPRGLMSLNIFRAGLIPEFLLRGLVLHDDGTPLSLPEKGSVSKEEIDSISPLALCENIPYPPIYQIFGTADEVFEVSHATEFDKKLKERGVESVAIVVPNMGHAFDVWAEVGGDVDEGIVRPAVGWVAGFAEVKQEVKGMI